MFYQHLVSYPGLTSVRIGSDWPTTDFGSDIAPDSDSDLASVAYYARQNAIGGKKGLVNCESKNSMDDQMSEFSFND